jgi:hypothetical protein
MSDIKNLVNLCDIKNLVLEYLEENNFIEELENKCAYYMQKVKEFNKEDEENFSLPIFFTLKISFHQLKNKG